MPLHRQIALQASALFLALCLAWPYYYLRETAWNWSWVCLLTGALAGLLANRSGQPWWWQAIHLGFTPALWLAQQLQVDPGWYLFAFVTLALVFRGAAQGQIPLYLSGENTARLLATELPPGARVADLGAGLGSLLVPLGRLRPDLHLAGVENAPLTWALGKLRCAPFASIAWHWGDLWTHPLAPYQAVYCFLSPVPMRDLWSKASREMAPGSLLISKAFPVPGQVAEKTLGDSSQPDDQLFIYRIGAES